MFWKKEKKENNPTETDFLLRELPKIIKSYGWEFIPGEPGSGDYEFEKNNLYINYSCYSFYGFKISNKDFSEEKVLSLSEFLKFIADIKPKQKKVMPPEKAIPILIKNGWVFDEDGDLVIPGYFISRTQFYLMGRPLTDEYLFPDYIIEEI